MGGRSEIFFTGIRNIAIDLIRHSHSFSTDFALLVSGNTTGPADKYSFFKLNKCKLQTSLSPRNPGKMDLLQTLVVMADKRLGDRGKRILRAVARSGKKFHSNLSSSD